MFKKTIFVDGRAKSLDLDVPSDRIEFALHALHLWQKRKGCQVDMNFFHDYDDQQQVCFACLGGAAAIYAFVPESRRRKTLQLNSTNDLCIAGGLSYHEAMAFETSLDRARSGFIDSMFRSMGRSQELGLQFNRRITDYDINPKGFFHDMRKLVRDLQRHGY